MQGDVGGVICALSGGKDQGGRLALAGYAAGTPRRPIMLLRYGLPSIGEELLQLVDLSGRDAGQNAGEVGLRINAVTLGAGDEGGEDGGGLGRLVVAGEKPVLAA